jgi:hypothetical protein
MYGSFWRVYRKVIGHVQVLLRICFLSRTFVSIYNKCAHDFWYDFCIFKLYQLWNHITSLKKGDGHTFRPMMAQLPIIIIITWFNNSRCFVYEITYALLVLSLSYWIYFHIIRFLLCWNSNILTLPTLLTMTCITVALFYKGWTMVPTND